MSRSRDNIIGRHRAGSLGPRRGGGAVARGFSLIEILIVVVILGILATVVIPQFSNASVAARENTLKDELRYLRTQIVVYMAQHEDVWPGPTAAAFVDQMTMYTNVAGDAQAAPDAAHKYGPYLSTMPSNPLNGLNTIKVIPAGTDIVVSADDLTGWLYKPSSGEIAPNVTGNDSGGTAYVQY